MAFMAFPSFLLRHLRNHLPHHPHPSARLPGAGFTHRYSAFVGPTHSPPIIGSWQTMVIMGMGPLEELKKVGVR